MLLNPDEQAIVKTVRDFVDREVKPVVRELDHVTGDGPSSERGGKCRGQVRTVGGDDARSHRRRCGLGRGWIVEDRPEPGVAGTVAHLALLGGDKPVI